MTSTAVVTGSSGYVATEVVKQLLEKGYTVRATVRSTSNKDKVGHLLRLGDALPGKITLHEADNLIEGSFDEVVKGADYVFHMASPFFVSSDNPQKDLVDPAVKGTKNVLKAVAKSKNSVKRVVLTSSLAAMMNNKKGPSNGSLYDEADWNTESTLDSDPYLLSKTEAERAAWAFAKEEGIDLVTIHPSLVMGPVISDRSDATSIKVFKGFVEEGEEVRLPVQVDVRDIGRAHVLAAEIESAKGRYLVSQEKLCSSKLLSQVLTKRFPEYSFPTGSELPDKQFLTNEKVRKELGLVLHPIEETYADMAATLIAKGVLKPKPKQREE